LDTTYLLPLAQIATDTDLLAAMAKGEANSRLEDVAVSLISIFELQAKAVKLAVPAKTTVKAIDAIVAGFRVIPFDGSDIVETSYRVRKMIPDYIDCVIVATAIAAKEELVTEDSLVQAKKDAIKEEYKLKVLNFKDMVRLQRSLR